MLAVEIRTDKSWQAPERCWQGVGEVEDELGDTATTISVADGNLWRGVVKGEKKIEDISAQII